MSTEMTGSLGPARWPRSPWESLDGGASRTGAGVARSDRVRFPFAFSQTYRQLGWCFGVSPRATWAEVSDDVFSVRFGPWRVHTALTNISFLSITGPYSFVKTAGPARVGLDRSLTFATNNDSGLLIEFHRSVAGVDPLGVVRHPNLTITVADPAALAAELRARGATSFAEAPAMHPLPRTLVQDSEPR